MTKPEAHARPFIPTIGLIFLVFSGLGISIWSNIILPDISLYFADVHMKTVNIKPDALFWLQQVEMFGFYQLLLTIAANIEKEVTAPVRWQVSPCSASW